MGQADCVFLAHVVLIGVLALLALIYIVIAIETKRNAKYEREWNQYYQQRLEDAEDFALETHGYSDAWYEAAARARCKEVLKQSAATRRYEAQRRIRTKDFEAEYMRTAAYGASRYGLDEKVVVEKLRKYDERQFKLLDLAIKYNQEAGKNGKSEPDADLDRSEEQGAGISAQTHRDNRRRKPPTWGGHREDRW
jgi:hypothetical protein